MKCSSTPNPAAAALQGQYFNGRPQLSGKVGPKSGLAFCVFSGQVEVRRVRQMHRCPARCCNEGHFRILALSVKGLCT